MGSSTGFVTVSAGGVAGIGVIVTVSFNGFSFGFAADCALNGFRAVCSAGSFLVDSTAIPAMGNAALFAADIAGGIAAIIVLVLASNANAHRLLHSLTVQRQAHLNGRFAAGSTVLNLQLQLQNVAGNGAGTGICEHAVLFAGGEIRHIRIVQQPLTAGQFKYFAVKADLGATVFTVHFGNADRYCNGITGIDRGL